MDFNKQNGAESREDLLSAFDRIDLRALYIHLDPVNARQRKLRNQIVQRDRPHSLRPRGLIDLVPDGHFARAPLDRPRFRPNRPRNDGVVRNFV